MDGFTDASSLDFSGAFSSSFGSLSPVYPDSGIVSTVPATPVAVPGPASISSPTAFLQGVTGLTDVVLNGYGTFNAAKLALARTEANSGLAFAKLDYDAALARSAINAGQTNGPVFLTPQGTVAGLSVPDRVVTYGQQWLDDIKTVPKFQNANVAIVLGVAAIALLVLRK